MATIDVDTLKAAHHATWAAGDYAAIAELIDEIPPRHLLDRVGIEAGQTVLDVATGTGNAAVRAAATAASPSASRSSASARSAAGSSSRPAWSCSASASRPWRIRSDASADVAGISSAGYVCR